MKSVIATASLFFAVVVLLSVCFPVVSAGKNGGVACAACTILNALAGQTMELKEINATRATDLICSYMPFPVTYICGMLIKNEINVPLLDAGESPDTICNAMKICFDETGQKCRLFPKSKGNAKSDHQTDYEEHLAYIVGKYRNARSSPDILKEICKVLPGVCEVVDHKPYFDNDGDWFSTHNELRGGYFRGRDCNDNDATVFPGRDTSDAEVDTNCNGIYGTDPATNKTYEDLYCDGTGAMGVAALGDSASAHFHLPPTYFNASELSKANFAHLFRTLEDEADWPMLSWSTGHFPPGHFAPDIAGHMTSLYSRMVERNKCNHRDYQNIGVNGARVQQLDQFDGLLNRNATSGVKPLLLLFSMVGNDVCDGHHGFDQMTTPAEYYRRVERAVLDADSFLPNGSHIVLFPEVDGRILYNAMHNRIHPIGWTNQDVTYTDFYDYLNCLHVNPCWGWMNSNATVRNMTTDHARLISDQIPAVINATAPLLKNVKVHYLGNIYMAALNNYTGPQWELIEPVDGFHPSQLGNQLIGQHLYNVVDEAGILAPENPSNAAIEAKFGDQGGY